MLAYYTAGREWQERQVYGDNCQSTSPLDHQKHLYSFASTARLTSATLRVQQT